MTAIEREKLRVYDYVSDCYKHSAQAIVYMNAIHPLETHDSAHVDDGTDQVVGGEELDDEHNKRILPPINPCPSGRPRVKRIESQRQGVKLRRCSNSAEEGHYRNTCRNPYADFHSGYEGAVVHMEDLLGGEASTNWH